MRNSLVIAITVSFFALGGLTGCDKGPDDGVIEIKEKMFLSQVNDVYLNADDYLGKTIKLEGIFKMEQWEEDTYCFVLRYGPGCCGDDGGNVGFEVKWSKDRMGAYPDTNSWVAATGVLKVDEQYLYLDLASLDVLKKRGVEIVRQ